MKTASYFPDQLTVAVFSLIAAMSLAAANATPRDARMSREAIVTQWDLHYRELEEIIANGGNLYQPSGERFLDQLPELDPDLAARGIGNADKEHALDLEAYYHDEDKTPLDIVLRRTRALLEYLRKLPEWKRDSAAYQSSLGAIALQAEGEADVDTRKMLYREVCGIRRELAFSNPLLNFDRLLFSSFQDVRNNVIVSFGSGRGVWVLHEPFGSAPRLEDVFANRTVQKGRYAGMPLAQGSLKSLELSFDAKRILFSWCPQTPSYDAKWDPERVYHLFEANVDGSNCVQLTDGPFSDLDPCYLPSGRIAFSSFRRSPQMVSLFLRCTARSPSVYTLHSCAADGSDIVTISYHDLPEYSPSVDHDGRLVYTRWEYYDKASHWTCNLWKMFPDGRDPRAPHGNYYYPHQTFDRDAPNGRGTGLGNPVMEISIRAVPGAPGQYTATASAVHFGELGSLVLINTNIRDDHGLGQLSRLTPEIIFPESEDGNMQPKHGDRLYGYCWPLSRDFYLCSHAGNICYLDRFGNREVIWTQEEVPGARGGLVDPIPLRPRPRPNTIPIHTYEGQRNDLPHEPATIKIMNIYDSYLPWPEGVVRDRKIKWLRVLQVFPKNNDDSGKYYETGYGGSGSLGYAANVDYGNVNGCRFPLGVVPVEDDGSAYFYAPVRKDIYFQALDENGMAIQSMRSATYVQPGEQLTCVGCHEDKWTSPEIASSPKALSRPPSVIRAEVVDGAVPFNFHRLVKPVFAKSCSPCHRKQEPAKAPIDMEYGSLREYAFCFTAPRSLGGVVAEGSHTIPGHFGALASRMGQALLNPTHQEAIQAGLISPDDFRRVVLWLDCNSAQFGSVHSLKDVYAQLRGETVFPKIDYEPWYPLGLEIYAQDDTPPSTVTGLRITPAAEPSCAIGLTWEPASDDESGVGCYAVYRDDQFLGWSVEPSYRDGNVVPGDQFTYHVLAVNRNGVEGPASERAIGACKSGSGVPHIVRWDDSNPHMIVSASGGGRGDLHDPLNLVNGSGLSGSMSKTVFDTSVFVGPNRRGQYLRRVSRGLNRTSLSGKNESHDTNEGNMWQSEKKQIAGAWVQFDLARAYRLRKLRIWNFNARPDDGVQRADILISTDGTNWTLHAEDVIFPRADGSDAYHGFQYDFGEAITATGVRIQVRGNYGGDAVGLAEVQFLHTAPEA